MERKTRAGRHCLPPRETAEVGDVPGLIQVLAAIDLLRRTDMTRVVVSIKRSGWDADLLALSREAADESGIEMEAESQGSMLVLSFARANFSKGK